MKKILVLTCLLALMCVSPTAAQKLVLNHADGTTTDMPLTAQSSITFSDGKTVVDSHSYAAANILKISYKPDAMSVAGDLNGDGNVDVGDIMAIINHMAEPSSEAGAFDLNGDGNVDVGDIMAIINIMAEPSEDVLASGTTEEVVSKLQDLSGTNQADAAAVAETLKSNPNVEEAYCEDGNNVIVKMKGDNCYSACPLYTLESVFSEDGEAEILIDMANESRRMNADRNSSYPNKVAIFNFFEGGPYNTKLAYVNFIAAMFENNGYVVENYGQGYDNNGIPTFTVDRLNDVISQSSQYAAIIIMSHGYETKEGNTYFATCERYDKDKTYEEKQTVLIDNNRFVAHSSKMNLDPQCLLYLGPCYGIPAKGYGQNPNTSVIGWQGKNAISQIHAGVFFHKLLYSGSWVGVTDALNCSIKEDPFNPKTKQYVSDNVGSWAYYNISSLQPSYVNGMTLVLEDFDNKSQRRETWSDTGVIPCDKFIKKTGKDAEFIINGYIRGDVKGRWVKIELEPIFRIQNKGEYSYKRPTNQAGVIRNFEGSDYDSYFEYVILTLDGDAPEGIYRINVKAYESGGWKLIKQSTPMYIIYSSILSDNYVRPDLNQEDVTTPRILDTAGQPVEEITLAAGTSKTFRVEAYDGHTLSTPCLDENVCTVSLEGTTLTVTGVAEGSTYFGVYDKENKQIGVAEVTVTASVDEPTDGETFTVNGVSFTMVNVEGGTFWMGSEENDVFAYDDERPRHQVTLSSFAIGQTEVTQELWEAVMGSNPSFFKGNNLPVDNVSWKDCQEFIDKLSELTGRTFRMPTEAEWEFAACGGNKSQGYEYAGSNDLDAVAWHLGNSGNTTHAVGTKAPNELDLYDMTGNMDEWCYDRYGPYSSEAQTNPQGPQVGLDRVVRGGGYGIADNGNRVKRRTFWDEALYQGGVSLRLAMGDEIEAPTYTSCPDDNHPHMIDLGLPSGTKWACCNVGASTPEDYGGYFAWGETGTKSTYNWDTYQYGSSYDNVVNIGSDIAGTQYDAATANWGSPWRMPSLTQIQELLNNCTSTWTTQNGVDGRKFTGSNGGTIFLPAAGNRWESDLGLAGSDGRYWLSALSESGPNDARSLDFDSGYAYWSYYDRSLGQSVRPVR